MKINHLPLLIIFFLTLAFQSKADSWIDPDWKRVLDSSDAVALVEYTGKGDFRAPAKILEVYRGKLKKGDAIWISGFSNRYGPVDDVKPGDRFIVFLNKWQLTAERLVSWQDDCKKDSTLIPFVNAIEQDIVYSVWSPTSGDLRVKGKEVQYDLVSPTYGNSDAFWSLKDFESFLKNYYSEPDVRKKYSHKLLEELKETVFNAKKAQLIGMMQLLGFDEFDEEFAQCAKKCDANGKYLLARLLANVPRIESRDLLVVLFSDENSLVQGEAVRSLQQQPNEWLGPFLVERLNAGKTGNGGPSNIMDPVRNTINGGQRQIVETLGEIGYKEAVPALLPLLETTEEYDFEFIATTISDLGSREYARYINMHLEHLDGNMVLMFGRLMRKDSLVECLPSLMSFVARHDKNVWPIKDYAISYCCGLGAFPTEEVRAFLVEDFLNVCKLPEVTGTINTKKKWVDEYMSTFSKLKMNVAANYFYDQQYNTFGLCSAFKRNPKLFERKRELEDSLRAVALRALNCGQIHELRVLAFIDTINPQRAPLNCVIGVTLRRGSIDSLKTVMTSAGIAQNNLTLTSGSSTYTYGTRAVEKFSEINDFLNYLVEVGDEKDLEFLKKLLELEFIKGKYETEKHNKRIAEMELRLRQ